jgi:catechol 2,3-dioxygenase-like lactoylglutathione lyase family enzyme
VSGERKLQVRFARHTERLDEVVRFYRDGLGLPEIGRFANHDGYDGVFLALPGTGAHLEFTSGPGHEPPEPHPETLPFSTSEAGRTRGQTPLIKWNG